MPSDSSATPETRDFAGVTNCHCKLTIQVGCDQLAQLRTSVAHTQRHEDSQVLGLNIFLPNLKNRTPGLSWISQTSLSQRGLFLRLLGFIVISFWWYTRSFLLERILLQLHSCYRQPANHNHLKSLVQELRWCNLSWHVLISWRQLRMWQDIQTCLATSLTYGLFEWSVSTQRPVIFFSWTTVNFQVLLPPCLFFPLPS